MKFIDLIKTVTWDEVEKSLSESYDHLYGKYKKRIKKKKLNNFKSAFYELTLIEPKDTEWRIVVKSVIEDGKVYADVSGVNGTLYKDIDYYTPEIRSKYADEEVGHDLSLNSWDEWLGMIVEEKSFEGFSPPEVVAHCLWELTFFGFTPDKE